MIDFKLMQATIIEHLNTLTFIEYCGAFPQSLTHTQAPALFIHCTELEPDLDRGTEQLGLISHWSAHLIVADSQKIQCPDLALAIMKAIHKQRFGLLIEPAQLKSATPDYFKPDASGYQAWVIEWSHAMRVGDNIWSHELSIPTSTIPIALQDNISYAS